MKSNVRNVIFDLAGVVFARDKVRCPEYLHRFFSFIVPGEVMPDFWDDYDRGTRTFDEVAEALAEYRGCEVEKARSLMREAITYQEEVEPTKRLIADLKAAGYRLYVLSNMSLEYIEYLRKKEVYSYFDGEVISSEVHLCKPEPEIYEAVLERYGLKASESLFLDDRVENVNAAIECGIGGLLIDKDDQQSSCEVLRQLLLADE